MFLGPHPSRVDDPHRPISRHRKRSIDEKRDRPINYQSERPTGTRFAKIYQVVQERNEGVRPYWYRPAWESAYTTKKRNLKQEVDLAVLVCEQTFPKHKSNLKDGVFGRAKAAEDEKKRAKAAEDEKKRAKATEDEKKRAKATEDEKKRAKATEDEKKDDKPEPRSMVRVLNGRGRKSKYEKREESKYQQPWFVDAAVLNEAENPLRIQPIVVKENFNDWHPVKFCPRPLVGMRYQNCWGQSYITVYPSERGFSSSPMAIYDSQYRPWCPPGINLEDKGADPEKYGPDPVFLLGVLSSFVGRPDLDSKHTKTYVSAPSQRWVDAVDTELLEHYGFSFPYIGAQDIE